MADGKGTVRRTLQFRFNLPSADGAQVLALMNSAAPFYEWFGVAGVRLLQNVDDPTRFVQLIEYETPEAIEFNRQRIASDPRIQAYLQTWRTFVQGAVDVDVFQEVTG
jgi:hypothetical protein